MLNWTVSTIIIYFTACSVRGKHLVVLIFLPILLIVYFSIDRSRNLVPDEQLYNTKHNYSARYYITLPYTNC